MQPKRLYQLLFLAVEGILPFYSICPSRCLPILRDELDQGKARIAKLIPFTIRVAGESTEYTIWC